MIVGISEGAPGIARLIIFPLAGVGGVAGAVVIEKGAGRIADIEDAGAVGCAVVVETVTRIIGIPNTAYVAIAHITAILSVLFVGITVGYGAVACIIEVVIRECAIAPVVVAPSVILPTAGIGGVTGATVIIARTFGTAIEHAGAFIPAVIVEAEA